MKKLFLVSLFFIVSTGLVFSQSITVTSPTGSDTWVKGNSYKVTWKKKGVIYALVKLTLHNASDGSLKSVITESTSNDGDYLWSIPYSVSPGEYKVRVTTVGNAFFDDSAQFMIADAGVSIEIKRPVGDWCKELSDKIIWLKHGPMSMSVKITLLNKDGSFNSVITMSTANDGEYIWKPFPSLSSGTYKIRIETVDNAVRADSAKFEIKSCAPPGPCSHFMVSKPQKNRIGYIGRKLEIRWGNPMHQIKKKNINDVSNRIDSIKKAGNSNKMNMVKIEIKNVKCPAIAKLIENRRVVNFSQWKTIKSSTPDGGYYSWTIPRTFKKGCYIIRVTRLWCDSNNRERAATSQVFRLLPFNIKPTLRIRK